MEYLTAHDAKCGCDMMRNEGLHYCESKPATIARGIAKRIIGWFSEAEPENEEDAIEIIATALQEYGEAEYRRGVEESAKISSRFASIDRETGQCNLTERIRLLQRGTGGGSDE